MTINRYQDQLITTSSMGTQVYSTSPTTTIETDINDSVIVAGQHDRFDTLANQFYGSAELWWVIAQANSLVNGSIHIPQGTRLIIPNKSKVL